MTPTPFELIQLVISAAGGSALIVAGLAGWLGKVWADRIMRSQTLLQDIDLDLRNRRIGAYLLLWKCTALLPKWPKAFGVSYSQLMQFSETLRTWYFETGGMYLSRSTHRDAYTPLQDHLMQVLSGVQQDCMLNVVTDAHYESIRAHCSALRTALAADIESRREGPA
jgi:hypothetical protein